MADPAKRYPDNAAGEFFVDRTCIDCDTCRQVAPATFVEGHGHSLVSTQPRDAAERRLALRALLCCPTSSIGTTGPARAGEVVADFPLPITDQVFFCGFNSEKSFGGHSYFLRHPAGNWLIDSPRWLPGLAKRFAELGGISHIFLTHQDDVADAARYAAHFSAKRVIHRDDLGAMPAAEIVLDGTTPRRFADDILAIPVPGHTAGSSVLLYRDVLFTGDHLWWNRDDARLGASKSYCWHSWTEQTASMERLLEHPFSWVLPGHGDRIHLEPAAMREQLLALIGRMRQSA